MKRTMRAINSYPVKLLLLALAYFLAGRLSLLLAIPPGFASPVWPAAGIALAGIILGGYRYFPAVLLGSFAANLIISVDSGVDITAERPILVAFSIAIGASLQAVISTFLVRRVMTFPTSLEREKEVGLLLALGGPIGCVINATLGTSTLVAADFIALDSFLINWFTWWVGDTIGVVLFTPLILILLSPGFATLSGTTRKSLVVIPSLVVFMFVMFVFSTARDAELQSIRDGFSNQTIREETFIKNELGSFLEILRAIEIFFSASSFVNRQEFEIFTQDTLAKYPQIQALEWIPHVPHAEIAAYEARAHKDGYPTFRITEKNANGIIVAAQKREEYFPVYYVAPYTGNETALGFDLGSHPARMAAMRDARDCGQPIVSGAVTLAQKEETKLGILIFHPIYKTGKPVDTVQERRQNLAGFALGVFCIGDLVNAVFDDQARELMKLHIYDNYVRGSAATLYGITDKRPFFFHRAIMELPGRQWTLEFSPTAAFLQKRKSWQAWLVLIGGLAFTSIVQMFLLSITATKVVKRLVDEKTAELIKREKERDQLIEKLSDSNEELERFAYVCSHDLQEPLRMIRSFSEKLQKHLKESLENDKKGQRYFHFVTDGAARAQELIADILNYSSVDRNTQKPEDININALVDAVSENMQVNLEDRGGSITRDDLPHITGNKTQIYQLVQNLINNGLKYQKPGTKPHVHVSVTDADTHWIFSIKDNGIGMEKRHLTKIFDVFLRLHRKDEYAGTGVGLSICKKVVERHGGRIWVESDIGKGSAFIFTILKPQTQDRYNESKHKAG